MPFQKINQVSHLKIPLHVPSSRFHSRSQKEGTEKKKDTRQKREKGVEFAAILESFPAYNDFPMIPGPLEGIAGRIDYSKGASSSPSGIVSKRTEPPVYVHVSQINLVSEKKGVWCAGEREAVLYVW